jgi:hypothetical protein
MPGSNLFSFAILVNNQPLKEYEPEPDDVAEPDVDDVSGLANIKYVEATPGDVFTIQIQYLGNTALSNKYAFDTVLYVDGALMDGRMFNHNGKRNRVWNYGKGAKEQAFVSSSNKRMLFSNIEFTENQIDASEEKLESIGCIQLSIKKICNIEEVEEEESEDESEAKDESEDEEDAIERRTSATKVWEKEKKISGRLSLATRHVSSISYTTDFKNQRLLKPNLKEVRDLECPMIQVKMIP